MLKGLGFNLDGLLAMWNDCIWGRLSNVRIFSAGKNNTHRIVFSYRIVLHTVCGNTHAIVCIIMPHVLWGSHVAHVNPYNATHAVGFPRNFPLFHGSPHPACNPFWAETQVHGLCMLGTLL